jgi:hypothetical protein
VVSAAPVVLPKAEVVAAAEMTAVGVEAVA